MAIEAVRSAAADTLRLYPDPQSTRLREALAEYHGVAPEQVFVGNGSDEVLAHAFAALLKQPRPVLFPDVTYSFYPIHCRLLGIDHETIPLDAEMRVRIADYTGLGGSIIIANPNAPSGIALSRAEIERLVSERADAPVVIDEAYVDFGAETAMPLIRNHPNLLVVQTLSKSRSLAGLRVGYAIGDQALIEALDSGKGQLQLLSSRTASPGGRNRRHPGRGLFPTDAIDDHRKSSAPDRNSGPTRNRCATVQRQLRLRPPPEPYRQSPVGRAA